MNNLRTKGKSIIVWILMALLILGLGGFGVTSFSGGGSAIGSVGDTKITAEDYNRALQSQMNALSQQTGQQFTMAQAETIGLPQAVQAQLFTSAALEEETKRIGVSVGDAQVAKVIAGAQAFQGPNGKFDRESYGRVLASEGLSEAEFEEEIRDAEAQQILERAITGGVTASTAVVDQSAKWRLQQRDFSYHEITEDQLSAPISTPDEETLLAWHKANADRFTAPEKRKITYVWLTPEMLADEVELNQDALRQSYEKRISEYQQPERRLVGRLVFPSMEEAQAAKKRLDAAELSFEELVQERGLTLDDVDLGEVREQDLGKAGDAVFGLEQPGVVGPVDSNLGPALYSMNAILDPIDVSFEEAKEELRAEAALDRAARLIEDQVGEYSDLLIGGATLEDAAKETELEIGTLDWSTEMQTDGGSIAGYPNFREAAENVTVEDFPELKRLEDGGVFALRLDEVIEPALIPFEEIRDEVANNWRSSEMHRLLLALAEEMQVAAVSEEVQVNEVIADNAQPDIQQPAEVANTESETTPAPKTPALNWSKETGHRRDGWIDGLPQQLVSGAFGIEKAGDVHIVDTENRVFLVRLDKIHEAELTGEDAAQVVDNASQRMEQSLQGDLFDYYARAIQNRSGVQLDQTTIDSINAQIR